MTQTKLFGQQIETGSIPTTAIINFAGAVTASLAAVPVTTLTEVTASNVLITGTATVRELNTLYVTSSTIYESGSTKFGDSVDDTHQFTGSIFITKGAIMNPSILAESITIPSGYNGLLVGPLTNPHTITVEDTATLTIV